MTEPEEPQEPAEGLLGTQGGETLTPETHPALFAALRTAYSTEGRRACWDHDLDGWCPLCQGDPDRCPRTARA